MRAMPAILLGLAACAGAAPSGSLEPHRLAEPLLAPPRDDAVGGDHAPILQEGRITAPFAGSIPVLAPYDARRHEGWDWATTTGTPILAAADGVVVDVADGTSDAPCTHGGEGTVVVIQPDDRPRRRIVYGNLAYTALRPGDPVVQGGVVGISGDRLHFGVGLEWGGSVLARNPYDGAMWAVGHAPADWSEEIVDVELPACGRVTALAVGWESPRHDAIEVDLRDCAEDGPEVELWPNDRAWSYRLRPGHKHIVRPDDVDWKRIVGHPERPGLWRSTSDCVHVYSGALEQAAVPVRGGRCWAHELRDGEEGLLATLPVRTTLARVGFGGSRAGGGSAMGPVSRVCIGRVVAELTEALAAYPAAIRSRAIREIVLVGMIIKTWSSGETEILAGLQSDGQILLDTDDPLGALVHHEIAHALAAADLLPDDPWPDLLGGFRYTWGRYRRGPVDPNALGGADPRGAGFVKLYGTSAAAEDQADVAGWVMTGADGRPRSPLLEAKRARLATRYRRLGIAVPPTRIGYAAAR